MTNFRLTPGDRQSDTWARIKKHLTERREQLRRELEKDADEAQTAKLRGGVRELMLLLDLERDEPNLPPHDGDHGS